VFLTDSGPSPFDLRFRMFGTDVRVHPMFWICSGLLGWGYVNRPILPGNGVADLLLWIGVTFASILLHEFGHVFAIKAFGNDAHIVLHGFGGYALPYGEPRWRWQRIAISAAGPGIQLALFGALVAGIAAGVLPNPMRGAWTPKTLLLFMLLTVNLFWPLFNLLPIWPLDGGKIARELFQAVSPRNGVIGSLWLSLLLAAAIALNAIVTIDGLPRVFYILRGPFIAIFFALFAVENFQAIQVENSMRRRPWHEEWP
jgi:Zn-dependent protease